MPTVLLLLFGLIVYLAVLCSVGHHMRSERTNRRVGSRLPAWFWQRLGVEL